MRRLVLSLFLALLGTGIARAGKGEIVFVETTVDLKADGRFLRYPKKGNSPRATFSRKCPRR